MCMKRKRGQQQSSPDDAEEEQSEAARKKSGCSVQGCRNPIAGCPDFARLGVCWFHGENQTRLQKDEDVSPPPRRNPGRGQGYYYIMSLKWCLRRMRVKASIQRRRVIEGQGSELAKPALIGEGFVLSTVESECEKDAAKRDAPTKPGLEEYASGMGQNKKHAGIEDVLTIQ